MCMYFGPEAAYYQINQIHHLICHIAFDLSLSVRGTNQYLAIRVKFLV